MKSRRVLSIILAVLLASALTACKGNNNVDAPSEISVPNESVSTPDTPDTPDSADNAQPDSDSAAKNKNKKKSAAVKPIKKDTDTSSDKDNSSDEDNQNPIMNYVGPYACDRASMNVRTKNKDEAEVTIQWSSSASAYASWSLSGTINKDTMTVEYDNCKKTAVEVNEYGLTVSENTEYENGKGRIIFNEDSTITWEDDQENIASGMVFRFNGDHETGSDSDAEEGNSKYISRGKAIAKVKEQAGWDTVIISAFEGYTPDGIEAWIVSVAPQTDSYDDKFITYYVNDKLCYTDDVTDSDTDSDTDDSAVYADISENKAIAKVKAQAGSDVGVYSSFEGYSPDGNEAWVITVSSQSDGEEYNMVTYYVSSRFCYSE